VSGAWIVKTTKPKEEIEQFLQAHAPWRMEIEFPGGIRSSDYGRGPMFNPEPTNKAELIEKHIPAGDLLGQRILDIGSNCGQCSLYFAHKYGSRPTGIDVVPRHIEVSTWLADAMGVTDFQFLIGDAQTWVEPNAFAAVFHFGTLYHLPNPLMSIASSAKSLRPGGWLALETICYLDKDPMVSKFIHGFNGDNTNYWALGRGALIKFLELSGCDQPKLIIETHPPIYQGTMSRVLYLARKRT
jgi:2-polyprenyl-3-methyl-5-hydroxy-6-metoxy-1,4-benzoquinol methylase